jgi:hypothetical protein
MRRPLFVTSLAVLISVLIAAPALATECVNASKGDQDAGAQVILGPDFETPIYISQGLQQRLDSGVVDFETGEGFHGIIGFDFDGDGQADVSTWFGVGPDGEIPLEAQFAGPACRGLTNIGIYLTQCVGV